MKTRAADDISYASPLRKEPAAVPYHRPTALLALTLALLGVLNLGIAGPATADPVTVEATPIPLHPGDANVVAAGKLRYRGGLQLQSADRHFGGFSALGLSADGARMVALSDEGRRLAANLVYDAAGNLKGLAQTELDTLADLDGRPLSQNVDADAESMSPGVDGEIIVAFERNHRLWRYLPGEVAPRPLKSPDELSKLPANNGIEALTLLADGRLLAISEGSGKNKNAIGWVSDPQGWSVLTYTLKGGFRATGAATLPDGDVMLLERRYTLRSGVAARVRRVAGKDVMPGAALEGALIGELRPPVNVDNMEGIETIRPAAGPNAGKTLVYLISDDNFNPLQRTLLMMFELTE